MKKTVGALEHKHKHKHKLISVVNRLTKIGKMAQAHLDLLSKSKTHTACILDFRLLIRTFSTK